VVTQLKVQVVTDTVWNESAESLSAEKLKAHVTKALNLFCRQFPSVGIVLREEKLIWNSPEIPFFGNFPNDTVKELVAKSDPREIIEGLWATAKMLNLQSSMLSREEEITDHLVRRYSHPQRKRVYLRGLLGGFLALADGKNFIEKIRRDLEERFPCGSCEFVFGFTGRCITATRIYENYGKSMLGAQHLVCRVPPVGVMENLWKVVLHEFGHLLKAEHETKLPSIMHLSFGEATTRFDPKNQERIQRYLASLNPTQ